MKIHKCITAILMCLVLIASSTGMAAFAEEEESNTVNGELITVEENASEAVSEEVSLTEDAVVKDAEQGTEEVAASGEETAAEPEQPLTEESEEEKPITNYNVVDVMSSSEAGIDTKIVNNKKGYSLQDYRSILIAGIDGGGRADLIIIFCYNKKNGSAKVFTVSRETYMQLSNTKVYDVYGKNRDFCKCNQAADFGGMRLLVKEMNRHLDLNITEYIAVDWDCAEALVEAMGGIDAEITSNSMLEALNRVLPAGNKINGIGKQKLNGQQAVKYLRVRHYYAKDGDKTEAGSKVREDRNRDIFVQLFNRAKTMDFADVLKVYVKVGRKLDTNMDIVGALELVKATSVSKQTAFPYKVKKMWDPDGYFWYNVMNTNSSNVVTLHKNIFGQKKYKLTSTASSLDKKTKTLAKKYLKTKRPVLSSATITANSLVYTGSPQTPTVSVKLGDRVLQLGPDYKFDDLKAQTNIGKYEFTISGVVDAYSGYSKKGSFTIGPKGTDLVALTAAKKSFVVEWNEQAEMMPDKQITGYQIQYGLKSNFSGAKTTTVKGVEKMNATIKKLKAKKKYYVRIRTYVTEGKTSYYSPWSEALVIKTK